jgi:Leucine-rich repeat (LRR) protein
MTNEIESTPPIPSELYPITYNDGFQISWSQNDDDDFQSYKLYESLSEDMSNDTLIYETDDRTDTTYFKTIQNFRYYQITSEDVWGLQSTSNIEVGDYDVELWGEYYSVLNTTSLNLLNSGLTGSIPSEIGNLTNLTYLYLYNNELSGSIPPEIGNLTNLTHLFLYDNELTGEIPPEIGNLTNLTFLGLNNNQLTGPIPSEIWNLTNLTYLRLDNNQLTGSIPPEIGNLTNLTYLGLDNNQLTGSIPPEIGNLTNLVLLNLSQNQLTGEIPESICDLNIDLDGICWGLNCFNISNNQLCPPYPSCIEDYVGNQDTSDCP